MWVSLWLSIPFSHFCSMYERDLLVIASKSTIHSWWWWWWFRTWDTHRNAVSKNVHILTIIFFPRLSVVGQVVWVFSLGRGVVITLVILAEEVSVSLTFDHHYMFQERDDVHLEGRSCNDSRKRISSTWKVTTINGTDERMAVKLSIREHFLTTFVVIERIATDAE